MPLPVYGTLWVLIIGFVAVQMPQGFRGIAASIRSTDRDLEDSAVMLGARRSRAVAVITLPLLRVAVLSTFLLLLMLSMRELTVPLFPYTTDTEILSIAIYDQFENGGALREASADRARLLRDHVPAQLPAPPVRRGLRRQRCLTRLRPGDGPAGCAP